MRTLEGASVMLITTAVVMMLVALPIGLSLSSSIISNNTVTTDQPIGDAPFDLPEGSGYKTEYKDGRWEIKTIDDGPFCKCYDNSDLGHEEITITINDSYEWISFAVYIENNYYEEDIFPFSSATVSDDTGYLNMYRHFEDEKGTNYVGYVGNETISETLEEECIITISTEIKPKITCSSSGEVYVYIEIIDLYHEEPTFNQ